MAPTFSATTDRERRHADTEFESLPAQLAANVHNSAIQLNHSGQSGPNCTEKQ
jgi:hypothetical protein